MSASPSPGASAEAKGESISTKSAIHHHLDDFLKDLNDRPDMMEQVSKYLQYRADWEKPKDILPVDELEERLDLVEKYQTWKRAELEEEAKDADPVDEQALKQAREWKIGRLAYSACMTMPISQLRNFVNRPLETLALDQGLNRIVEAVRSLLFASQEQSSKINNPRKRSGAQDPKMKRASKRRTTSHGRTDPEFEADDATEESAHSARDRSYSESTNRSISQRNQARKYDENQCRISGAPQPEVAHLIPFSWGNSDTNMDRTKAFRESFSLFDVSIALATRIAGGELGEADKFFNMLCLETVLHKKLDKGELGLKFLGDVDIPAQPGKPKLTEITLQVVWLPIFNVASISSDMGVIDMEKERDKESGFAYNIQSRFDATAGHKVFRDPGWPISSGDKFTVQRPTDVAPLFIEAIKLRWHLGLVAAISGAAGDPEFIFGQDDDFEKAVIRYGKVRRQVERETAERELEERKKRAAYSPSKGKQQVPAPRSQTPQPPPSMPGDLGDITNLPIRRQPGSKSKESSPTKTSTGLPTEASTRQQTAAGSGSESVQVRGRPKNRPSREEDGE